jgi:hypothetical protein
MASSRAFSNEGESIERDTALMRFPRAGSEQGVICYEIDVESSVIQGPHLVPKPASMTKSSHRWAPTTGILVGPQSCLDIQCLSLRDTSG